MFTKNNKIYADAGMYLASGMTIGYELPADMEDVEEKPVVIDDMELRTAMSGSVNAHCTEGLISFGVKSNKDEKVDYAKLKTNIIKMRYSNDDLIAIILNKDNDENKLLEYNRMQQWREYATKVAKKIVSLED